MVGDRKPNDIRSESGEVMLESILVMIPTLIVMFFLLSLGFFLYAQCSVQVAADDAATKIAQTYKLIPADVTTGQASEDDIAQIDKYRYLFGASHYKAENSSKAISYAGTRLSNTSLINKKRTEDIKFDIVLDGVGRKHIEVTINAEYEIPLGGFLALFGQEPTRIYTATASAECIDIMDYYSTVAFENRLVNYLDQKSKIVKAVSAVIKLFTHEYK